MCLGFYWFGRNLGVKPEVALIMASTDPLFLLHDSVFHPPWTSALGLKERGISLAVSRIYKTINAELRSPFPPRTLCGCCSHPPPLLCSSTPSQYGGSNAIPNHQIVHLLKTPLLHPHLKLRLNVHLLSALPPVPRPSTLSSYFAFLLTRW